MLLREWVLSNTLTDNADSYNLRGACSRKGSFLSKIVNSDVLAR
jgi:hypothetical protein